MELTAEQRQKFSKIGKSNVATAKAHERRVAKLLTEWSGAPFRRRRVEGRGDDVNVVEGVADVISASGHIYFAIEAKKGEGFSLDALMADPVSAKFTSWWHQASYDAKILSDRVGQPRYPMLFFKPHPNWDWVAVPQYCFAIQPQLLRPRSGPSRTDIWFPHIEFRGYRMCGPISKNVSQSKKNPVMVPLQLDDVYICRWSDFADQVQPLSIFVQN